MNDALVLRLASQRDEAKLRSVVLSLNRSIAGVKLENCDARTNMLDMVNYGINNPVSARIIFDFLEEPRNNPRKAR